MTSTAERSIIFSMVCAVIGIWQSDEVIGQQWPAQSPPVENSVPQYRSPGPSGGRQLPLDYFKDSASRSGGQGRASSRPTKPVFQGVSDAPVKIPARMQPTPAAGPLRPGGGVSAKPRVTLPKAKGRKGKAKDKSAGKAKSLPVLDESIFRDTSPYPIDHRKPCWQCGQGNHCQSCLALGNKGRPYKEKLYGGCECDSRKPNHHPNFSVHWPRPFSAFLDERHPERAARRYDACPDKYIVDVFNPLSKLKLSKYKRTDNGYCGNDSDPYGCLGESKLR